MNVKYLNINDLKSKQSLDIWLRKLPQSIIEDVKSYLQEKDQWRVLGGKLLLKDALDSASVKSSLEELKFTDKGKPFFIDSDFKFNISHSGDMVVLVTAENQECGVDVELHRNINFKDLKSKFTDKEWSIIMNAEDSQKQFFHFWSIKESIIKADGRGVAVLSKTEILTKSTAICDNREWFIQPFKLAKGYSSSVATSNPIHKLEIQSFI